MNSSAGAWPEFPKVILLIESSCGLGRALLRGSSHQLPMANHNNFGTLVGRAFAAP